MFPTPLARDVSTSVLVLASRAPCGQPKVADRGWQGPGRQLAPIGGAPASATRAGFRLRGTSDDDLTDHPGGVGQQLGRRQRAADAASLGAIPIVLLPTQQYLACIRAGGLARNLNALHELTCARPGALPGNTHDESSMPALHRVLRLVWKEPPPWLK